MKEWARKIDVKRLRREGDFPEYVVAAKRL
jgi:hypothetical protein